MPNPTAPSSARPMIHRQGAPEEGFVARSMRNDASCEESSSGMPGLLGLSTDCRQPLLIFRVVVAAKLGDKGRRQALLQALGRLECLLQTRFGALRGWRSVEFQPQRLSRVNPRLGHLLDLLLCGL